MTSQKFIAVDTPNRWAHSRDRKLAYRSIGSGKPIVLCSRFRGHMDIWDPAFLDGLADQGFQVITFDYSGLGLSGGTKCLSPIDMAVDAADLIEALELKDVVIAGWSVGGLAAEVVVASHPQNISHAAFIGANPPGHAVMSAEQLFFDTATKLEYAEEDEIILFFEPKSPASRAAARRTFKRIAFRTEELSVPWPADWSVTNLGSRPQMPPFPADFVLEAMKTTSIPMLHIGGDHDIALPVENWYALNQDLPTLQLLTFPLCGHGPQHQYPEACAKYIAAFVNSTPLK